MALLTPVFGWVSDKIGRKVGMFICTGIIFVFSILSASAGAGASPQVQVNCLIAFRTLLGVGIGGEYPSGSVTAAEVCYYRYPACVALSAACCTPRSVNTTDGQATENKGVKKTQQQRLFVWATNTMLDLAFPLAWFVPCSLVLTSGSSHSFFSGSSA